MLQTRKTNLKVQTVKSMHSKVFLPLCTKGICPAEQGRAKNRRGTRAYCVEDASLHAPPSKAKAKITVLLTLIRQSNQNQTHSTDSTRLSPPTPRARPSLKALAAEGSSLYPCRGRADSLEPSPRASPPGQTLCCSLSALPCLLESGHSPEPTILSFLIHKVGL